MMANAQMGTFNLERNGFSISNSCRNPLSNLGFSIYPKPVFRFALNTKTANRIWILSVRTPNCRIINAIPKKESENQSINGGFLEKEFKFEPAFDEYLKVMENVRSDRKKNPSRDVDRYHSEKKSLGDDNAGAPVSAGYEDDGDLGGPDWNSRRVKNFISVERGEGGKNAKNHVSDANRHQTDELSENDNGGARQVQNSPNNKSGFRGSDGDLKDDRILGLYRKYNGIKGDGNGGDLERRKMKHDAKYSQVRTELPQNGRWIKDQVSSVDKKIGESQISKSVEDVRRTGNDGNFDIATRYRSDRRLRKVELDSNDHSTEMQKKQLQQNKTWTKGRVDNVEIKMDESDIDKGIARSEKFRRTNFTSKIGAPEISRSILEGKSSSKMNIQMKTSKSETNDRISESARLFRSEVEEKMDEAEMNKHKTECESPHRRLDVRNQGSISRYKKGMAREIESDAEEQSTYADGIGKDFRDRYISQNYGRLHEDSAEVENMGSSGIDIPKRFSKNSVHAGKGGGYIISPEHKKVRGPSQVFMKGEDNNSLEMERKAFKSFEVFTDVRGRPRVLRMEMEERIQMLAKWLNGSDVDMPEWQFSKMMHSAKIRFTDHSISRVVQILGALGNWRRVLQVVQWLQSRDRFKSYKSRYIYTTVLSVLGKAKRPVEALNIFYAMRQQFSSYPDLAAYHCIAVTLGQAGHMKELFDVIDCMRALPQKKFKTGMLEKWDPRLEPDMVVYNAVLNACVQRKQWEGAFWVLEQLKQRWIQPSSTTYGLAMEVMFACGKYSLVHEFFRKVGKTSIPNTLNYKVLVNTLWREGKTDEAVLVVQDMERRGIVGSASLYYDLARCLCSAGRCQEALQQIDKICKVAKKPLVVTYTGLIQACLESGSIQNGAYIFNQMHEFCSPNIVTCNIMLKAYVENKMFEEAKDLFQKLLDGTHYINSVRDYKYNIIPDKFTFNTMLEACVEEKRWDDFENFYRRMLHHGYHFNSKRHLRMILEASRAGKGQSLDTTWHHLVRSGRTVPLAIIKERFCMKLQEDDIAAALSCIHSYQTSGPHYFSEKEWLDLFNGNADRFRKDTLVRLVNEVNTLVSERDQLNSIYQNLLHSCREFFRAHVKETATSPSLNGRTSDVEVNY